MSTRKDLLFKTRICTICDREFIICPEYLYKLKKNGKTNYYCSYTCWRKDGGDNK